MTLGESSSNSIWESNNKRKAVLYKRRKRWPGKKKKNTYQGRSGKGNEPLRSGRDGALTERGKSVMMERGLIKKSRRSDDSRLRQTPVDKE